MNIIIKIEEIAKFILAYILTMYIGFAWWVFLVWLFVPDLSMIGYTINTKVGAWLYNLFHHQALSIAVGLSGIFLGSLELQLAGLVLFGHSAFDRSLGYGLKYNDDFKNTHLGWIGKKKGSNPGII